MSRAVEIARTSAEMLVERVLPAVRAARAGVQETTSALQTLPDETLRWLTAGSVGFAAGLRLAGAPRLVRAVGVVPALLVGAAIALRPTRPAVRED